MMDGTTRRDLDVVMGLFIGSSRDDRQLLTISRENLRGYVIVLMGRIIVIGYEGENKSTCKRQAKIKQEATNTQ